MLIFTQHSCHLFHCYGVLSNAKISFKQSLTKTLWRSAWRIPEHNRQYTKSLNPHSSICSTIWNLLLAEKEVRGTLVAFILVGRFKLSIAVLKSCAICYYYPNDGNGNDGIYPCSTPKLYYHDIGIIIYYPVFYLYIFFMYSIVFVCYSSFLCIRFLFFL